MALLRQSVRDASTQVLPSPAGHPGDAQNARPGRRKGPRASGLARRRLPGHAFPRSALTRQPADGAHNVQPPLPPLIQNVHGASSAVAASESGGKKHLGVRHGHRHVPEATRTHLAFASLLEPPLFVPVKKPECLQWGSSPDPVFRLKSRIWTENTHDVQTRKYTGLTRKLCV